MSKERLQKVLSQAGIASRRTCEQYILDGRVSVNGQTVTTLPVIVDTEKDSIRFDGDKISIAPEQKVYLMMNKPKEVLCTVRDDHGRRTVIDLIPSGFVRQRVFPVGRLDKESQGLLLLTNDGELTKKLTHLRYGIDKVYLVEVNGLVDGTIVEQMLNGVWLSDGRARAGRVKIIRKGKRSIIEVTLREGKNRQVYRMLAKLGLSVSKLVRIRLGSLELRGVGVGRTRRLTAAEVSKLKALVSGKL
jgi:pseudouridine synthase